MRNVSHFPAGDDLIRPRFARPPSPEGEGYGDTVHRPKAFPFRGRWREASDEVVLLTQLRGIDLAVTPYYARNRCGERHAARGRSGDRPYDRNRSGERHAARGRSGDRPYDRNRSGERHAARGRSGDRPYDREPLRIASCCPRAIGRSPLRPRTVAVSVVLPAGDREIAPTTADAAVSVMLPAGDREIAPTTANRCGKRHAARGRSGDRPYDRGP